MARFTQHDEDSARLPEGVRRIAYDADTQQYTFRDRSGQLYQNSEGDTYGVLKPVSAPATPRRRVAITERRDPALLRARSVKRPAKTFDDFLPPEYITNAEDSNSTPASPSEKTARAIKAGVVRRRMSTDDERRRLLCSPSSPADEEREGEWRPFP